MIRFSIILFLLICSSITYAAGGVDKESRDLFSDTWVGTDALGREMPLSEEIGGEKNDKVRTVGMFYITWHTEDKATKAEYSLDVSKVLSAHPEARLDGKHQAWEAKSIGNYYHWAEPEMGYFLSADKWVIRKDMSMLSDAGVDVLIMDVTNAVRYWEQWDTIFSVMQEMKAEGNVVPKFCFWAFNGPVITVIQELYERIYKNELYDDLWFNWQGKPLLLYNNKPFIDATGKKRQHANPNYDSTACTDASHLHYQDPDYCLEFYQDYTQEVKDFFTLKTMWWGYYKWAGERFVGTPDHWSFGYDLGNAKVKNLPPDSLVSYYNGSPEQAAVTPAQHSSSMIGKCWTREHGQPQLDEYDMPVSTYVPWLGKTVDNPTAYGIYFQDRWDEALQSDPAFLYINDWNEWTAAKFPPEHLRLPQTNGKVQFLGRASDFLFVDQYNAEFNRGIQPMKGGYTDNYYMQMAQNIRKYKGARPIPVIEQRVKINIDAQFNDWEKVAVEYRDTKGDVAHRAHNGYGNLHYTNTSGRNDILTSKVMADKTNLYFYVETASDMSPHTDDQWMMLLIDADQNAETGWFGYDYLVRDYKQQATSYKYEENQWQAQDKCVYAYSANELELGLALQPLGLSAEGFSFDYKWVDNPKDLEDIISLCTHGDAAPNRRFNYRCIYKPIK